eukprot:scaffold171626_cov41-Prasinocladus_malaysianus.AAC.1
MVEDHGVRILIDPGALMHVIGTKMDFVTDRLRWPLPTGSFDTYIYSAFAWLFVYFGRSLCLSTPTLRANAAAGNRSQPNRCLYTGLDSLASGLLRRLGRLKPTGHAIHGLADVDR